ncbi:hypothetical protein LMG28727_05372 [Paraburkholderia kirstenboschensis]|uniref:hypothetical protein n=1 Tax=Paraburkholderia kirstenboschensis TaxID=1245436 RepID=UPI000A861BAB|nr:hypothetical protein [Paraburkholderia kirstenboschensis]CAD6552485.1 hypothetical protein LMG28727_05372 [Paraburkholderia kirstenboschensis]
MQPDQTATEFSQSQPLLATSLAGVSERAPHRQIGLLARVTFCFAWLFGLEPFLTGVASDPSQPGRDRH